MTKKGEMKNRDLKFFCVFFNSLLTFNSYRLYIIDQSIHHMFLKKICTMIPVIMGIFATANADQQTKSDESNSVISEKILKSFNDHKNISEYLTPLVSSNATVIKDKKKMSLEKYVKQIKRFYEYKMDLKEIFNNPKNPKHFVMKTEVTYKTWKKITSEKKLYCFLEIILGDDEKISHFHMLTSPME